jgi:hypothetical protein
VVPRPIVRVLYPADRSADAIADGGSAFDVQIGYDAMPATAGYAWQFVLDVRYRGVDRCDAAIAVAVTTRAPVPPLWLIPGVFYGENRPGACTRLYPRYDARDIDLGRFVSNAWSFRVDRAATPVVFGWDEDRCVALSTTPESPIGLPGLGFALTGADEGELRLFFPYHEAPVSYDGSETPGPADMRFHRWLPGDSVRLMFAVHVLSADPHAYAPVVRDLHRRLAVTAAGRPWVSVADAGGLAAEGLVRWHYRATDSALLETAAFERDGAAPGDAPGDRVAMHVAWVSGAPAAYALLEHGHVGDDEDALRAGKALAAGVDVLDNIATHLAPCGTFWAQWSAERGWGKGWTRGEDRLHARTLAEATLFMTRAVVKERERGVARDAWRSAVASNLAFVERIARHDGALGSAYHARSGRVESWDGAAGMAWIPALVEGARLLHAPRLIELARRAGSFYARFVDDEFINGAPEDVDLAPTSEDGYVAVMAYVALAEAAEDDDDRVRWTDVARRAADWMLTFRYAWNVTFPRHTLLDVYDFRTRGADQASVANQHLHAYGLVCQPELVRLAALTGDDWYLERAREHLDCFRQFIARVDGEFNARIGMAPERYYQTACFGPKGGIGALSHAWCLGLLLYACDEAARIPALTETPATPGSVS